MPTRVCLLQRTLGTTRRFLCLAAGVAFVISPAVLSGCGGGGGGSDPVSTPTPSTSNPGTINSGDSSFSYTVNTSAENSYPVSGSTAVATAPGGELIIRLVAGEDVRRDVSLFLYTPLRTGTYTVGNGQEARAIFSPEGSGNTDASYGTTLSSDPNLGTITITSISGTTVQGSFSFRVTGFTGASVSVSSGTFTATVN